MKVHDCVQLSDDWFELHRGRPTASSFDRILTAKTLKLSASADSLIDELIADIYYPGPLAEIATPLSKPMAAGIEREPAARSFYELEQGVTVQQVGFVTTEDGRFGCSPDAMVNGDGALELKCPMGKTHVGYLREGILPNDYKAQVHGHLIVTGREWCDFMSYCPPLPSFVIRVKADDFTAALRAALDVFYERFQAALAKIRSL